MMAEPFAWLKAVLGFSPEAEKAEDGFSMLRESVAWLLEQRGITSFPGADGRQRLFRLFYDDWYLFAVPGPVYGLVKLREQEFDAAQGLLADGDTPGITVSFVSLNREILKRCLGNPAPENILALSRELARITSSRDARHDEALKVYFLRPRAWGPYRIAEAYVRKVVTGHTLALPENAAHRVKRRGRLRRFLLHLNECRELWRGEALHFQDPQALTPEEKQAVLGVHTGNFSTHSFAAEVRFHAWFLFPLARLTLPGINRSLYQSAIRADMSLGRHSLQELAPYYHDTSLWVKQQKKAHPEQDW